MKKSIFVLGLFLIFSCTKSNLDVSGMQQTTTLQSCKSEDMGYANLNEGLMHNQLVNPFD